jgi:hypothetical protein
MRKVFLVFLFLLCGGCAARRIYLPQVSSPAAEGSGVFFQGTPFQVINSTFFHCRIIIGKKDVGVVSPGDILWDNRRWHNQWQQYFAVAAICYSDGDLKNYIGVGGRVLVLSDYNVAEWTIRPGEIRTPDGRPVRVPSASAASPTSRRIKLPREWWASSVGVQIINNTPEDLKIFVNGRPVSMIGTAGVDYVRAELFASNFPRPLIITITNGTGCTYTEQVWVQRNYPWVRQILFGPEYCRWR